MRIGQRTTDELLPLMTSMGFVACGSNMGAHDNWGDVVFLSRKTIESLGWKFTFFRLVDLIGLLLKKYAPGLDRKITHLAGALSAR
jgi:hypothetical protein